MEKRVIIKRNIIVHNYQISKVKTKTKNHKQANNKRYYTKINILLISTIEQVAQNGTPSSGTLN